MARLFWPLLALAALLLFNALFTPGFFEVVLKDGRFYGTPVDILNRSAPVGVVALGMALVIATGGVDLSVGAVMAIAGASAALLLQQGAPAPVALLAALGAALLCGVWNGILVALLRIQPIVATLLLMVAGRGIAQLMTEGQIIRIAEPLFAYIGGGYLLWMPFSVSIMLMMLIFAGGATRLTALGLFIEAVGDNEIASRFAGISDRVVKLLAYSFSGLCAGVAGVIAAGNISAADANTAGLYLELDAILAVVIGGTALTGGRFSLIGALIGALIIQSLTRTIYSLNVPVEYNLVIKALVVTAVFLLQSERSQQLLRHIAAMIRSGISRRAGAP